MTDITNTNELTEQNEKLRATLSLAEADLRDYFAAKAMQGIVASVGAAQMRVDEAADFAYLIADAMLAAREKKEGDA